MIYEFLLKSEAQDFEKCESYETFLKLENSSNNLPTPQMLNDVMLRLCIGLDSFTQELWFDFYNNIKYISMVPHFLGV